MPVLKFLFWILVGWQGALVIWLFKRVPWWAFFFLAYFLLRLMGPEYAKYQIAMENVVADTDPPRAPLVLVEDFDASRDLGPMNEILVQARWSEDLPAIAFDGVSVMDFTVLPLLSTTEDRIAGLAFAGLFAAIMSTADSQLLVSSAALTEDFYKSLFNQDASPESLVKISRIAVVAIAIVAWLLALDPDSSVLGLVSYAWAGFGAAFGPAIILSLFWARMNRQGCLAGILIGGITVVVWKQLSGGIFDVYEIVPGFILATISIIAVSLATPEPDQDIQAMFSEAEES